MEESIFVIRIFPINIQQLHRVPSRVSGAEDSSSGIPCRKESNFTCSLLAAKGAYLSFSLEFGKKVGDDSLGPLLLLLLKPHRCQERKTELRLKLEGWGFFFCQELRWAQCPHGNFLCWCCATFVVVVVVGGGGGGGDVGEDGVMNLKKR
ncbi:hypothetical protein CFP56_007176 [Quercus suber]|uniref:Uncharacterized protein n=1 Tax=Quercus suber TaxID=58331 RepID=A0AAW0L8L4_QUESU